MYDKEGIHKELNRGENKPPEQKRQKLMTMKKQYVYYLIRAINETDFIESDIEHTDSETEENSDN